MTTATSKYDDLNQHLLELAIKTGEWATALHCGRDKQLADNPIENFFVIVESKSSRKNGKPTWLDLFKDLPPEEQESERIFPLVKAKMMEIGIPICYKEFNGHYIGYPGEQGNWMVSQFHYIMTLAQTLKVAIESVIEGDHWYESVAVMESRLRPIYQERDVLELLSGVQQFMLSVGHPVQHSFAELLAARNHQDITENTS